MAGSNPVQYLVEDWVDIRRIRSDNELVAVLIRPLTRASTSVLLAGPFGARPPLAHRGDGSESNHAWRSVESPLFGCATQRALVLLWDGVSVELGCDRAVRCAPADWWDTSRLYGQGTARLLAMDLQELGLVEAIIIYRVDGKFVRERIDDIGPGSET